MENDTRWILKRNKIKTANRKNCRK